MTSLSDTADRRARLLAFLTAGTVAGLMTALVAPTAAIAAPRASSAPEATLEVVEIINTDLDADGMPEQRETISVERSTRGVLLSVSETLVDLSTGDVVTFRIDTYEYTHDGRTALTTTEQGTGDTVEQIDYRTFFYDGRGDATRIVQEVDTNADGTIDFSTSTTTTGSVRELQTISTFEFDGNGDGIADVSTVSTSTFDRRGNPLESRDETDQDGDGSIDRTDVLTYTYSQRGQVLEQLVSIMDVNGTTTFANFSEYNSRGFLTRQVNLQNGLLSSEQTASYTANGTLANVVIAYDVDNDGELDETSTTEYRYDRRGTLSEFVNETRTVEGDLLNRREYVQETDARGNLISSRETDDRDGDGTVDRVLTITSEMDTRGRAVEETVTQDSDADGSPDSITTVRTVFAANGTLLERIQEFDTDADGIVDSTVTYTYPAR